MDSVSTFLRKITNAILGTIMNSEKTSKALQMNSERAEDAAIAKYKQLFDYSTEVLANEHERFKSADEKASKYTTILTFLLGVVAYVDKWTIEHALPPHDFIDWAMIFDGGATLISAVVSWFLVSRVITSSSYRGRPLNAEVLSFYRKHRLIDIYYAFAKANAAALEENSKKTAQKYRKLIIAFRWMYAAAVGLLLLIGLFSWKLWKQSSDFNDRIVQYTNAQETKLSSTEVTTMDKFYDPLRENEPKPQPPSPPQAPNEPDENVEPPGYPEIHRIRREDIDPGKTILH